MLRQNSVGGCGHLPEREKHAFDPEQVRNDLRKMPRLLNEDRTFNRDAKLFVIDASAIERDAEGFEDDLAEHNEYYTWPPSSIEAVVDSLVRMLQAEIILQFGNIGESSISTYAEFLLAVATDDIVNPIDDTPSATEIAILGYRAHPSAKAFYLSVAPQVYDDLNSDMAIIGADE